MTDSTPAPRRGRWIYWGAFAVLVAAFAFNAALAARLSILAVAIFATAVASSTPFVRARMDALPVFRRVWLRRTVTVLLLVVSLWTLFAADRVNPSRKPVALVGATILTGRDGDAAIPNGVVLVDGQGIIAAVGPVDEVLVPDGFAVREVSGKYLMPGLINAHDHLMMPGSREPLEPADFTHYVSDGPGTPIGEWLIRSYIGERVILALMERNAEKALRAGVTTVRELATPGFLDVALREAIERGDRIGPRVIAAGEAICITGGHTYQIGRVVDGPVDARRAVREAIHAGVDLIKIANTGGVADSRRLGEAGELQLTPEEMGAIVDEAHRKNLFVTAHAESTEGVLEALRAGVDNIEHGAPLNEEAIELFLRNPLSLRGYTTLHPTLSVLGGGVAASSHESDIAGVRIMSANAELIGKRMLDGFRDALKAGVMIGAGTDAGVVRHDAVWRELELFAKHGGVSNEEAIHMGTLQTARSIGWEQVTGSVEVGKSADLIVLDEDPRVDLSVLASPSLVMSRGFEF